MYVLPLLAASYAHAFENIIFRNCEATRSRGKRKARRTATDFSLIYSLELG